MSALDTLEEYSWNLLDKIGLADTFEDHGIPPIIFPLAIILLVGILIAVLVFMGPAGAEFTCGDGVCLEGEEVVCPEDCNMEPTVTKKDIKVSIIGDTPSEAISVKLYSDSGKLLSETMTTKSIVTFQDIEFNSLAYAVVSCSSGSQAESPKVDLSESSSLRVSLPNDFCQTQVEYGSIRVSIVDTSTNEPITATVSILARDGRTVKYETVEGSDIIGNIEAGSYYYLVVSKTGYSTYNGQSEQQMVYANSETSYAVKLAPVAAVTTEVPKGEFEVCVEDEDGTGIETSGTITVFTADGQPKVDGRLSDCPLQRGLATSEGCFVFSLPAGEQFYAMVTHAPKGCSSATKTDTVIIDQTRRQRKIIELDCNLTGLVKVIVTNSSGYVMTEEVNVTLYDEDGDEISGSDGDYLQAVGDYTEAIRLPAGTEVYAKAFDYSDKYDEDSAKSSEEEIEENETLVLEIELELPPPPDPPLTISGLSVSPAGRVGVNKNITITVDEVLLDDEAVWSDDGVSIIVQASWDSEDVEMNFIEAEEEEDQYWTVNVTSPDETGEVTMTITASKEDAEEDAVTKTLTVVQEAPEGEALRITKNTFRTLSEPAELSFNILLPDGSSVSEEGEMISTNLTVFTSSISGDLHEVVSDIELEESNDVYFAEIYFPFRGEFTIRVEAQAMVEDVLYQGSVDMSIIALSGAGATIEATIPAAIDPHHVMFCTATVDYEGQNIAWAPISLTIDGLPYSMTWSEVDEEYQAFIVAPGTECAYSALFALKDDEDVYEEKVFYVIDSYGYDCLDWENSPSCEDEDDARAAKECFDDDYLSYSEMIECADNIWTEVDACVPQVVCGDAYCDLEGGETAENCPFDCTETPSWVLEECEYPFRFKVKAILQRGWFDDGEGEDEEQGWVFKTKTVITDEISHVVSSLNGETKIEYDRTVIDEAIEDFATLFTKERVFYYLNDVHIGTISVPGDSTNFYSNGRGGISIDPGTGEVAAYATCVPIECGDYGDMNNNGIVDGDDEVLLDMVLFIIESVGYGGFGTMPSCADYNRDGSVNVYDYDCMVAVNDGQILFPYLCASCEPADLEICGDSADNNCDGQYDEDVYDEATNEFFSPTGEDLCTCIAQTPCDMIKIDSETGGSLICGVFNAPEEDNTIYEWVSSDFCDEEHEDYTRRCEGITYTCRSRYGNWEWRS